LDINSRNSGFINSRNLLQFCFTALTGQQSTYVAGVRIRYRQVQLGQVFSTQSSTTILQDSQIGSHVLLGGTSNGHLIQEGQRVEFVITPLVRNAAGQVVETTNSWYGNGVVTPFLDIFTNLNMIRTLTATAIGSISSAIVQQTTEFTVQIPSNGWSVSVPSNAISPDNFIWNLKFSAAHITGYHGVRIYRRAVRKVNGAPSVTPVNGYYANFKDQGRWELVGDILASDTVNYPIVNDLITVNLRQPTSTTEFNTYYERANLLGASSDVKNLIVRSGTRFDFNAIPLHNNALDCEFLIQVITGGGSVFSTRCTIMPGLPDPSSFNLVSRWVYDANINVDTTGRYIRAISSFDTADQTRYHRNLTPRSAQFTASISGTTMTVSAVASGTLTVGMTLRSTANTLTPHASIYFSTVYIVSQSTGTTGSTGTYVVSESVTLSSTTVFGTDGARTLLPNTHIVRRAALNSGSNASSGATVYTPPSVSPTII
jgi:hypothetical protein